ncbi:MAG: hypothetical protein AAFP82_05985 [Bacteroidota bacterium]
MKSSGGSNAFLDAARLVGGNTSDFVGTAPNLTGGTVTDSDLFGTGSAATYAFNNGAGANQGLEIVIDYAALGISSVGFIEAFAFVVSSSGFFSDVTVPGNDMGSNPGFNACYSSRPGGPYNSGSLPLPVELLYFNGKSKSDEIQLSWSTVTEINNSHFEIEHSQNAKYWNAMLFNFSGQLVKIFQFFDEDFVFNTLDLPNGKYTLSIHKLDHIIFSTIFFK